MNVACFFNLPGKFSLFSRMRIWCHSPSVHGLSVPVHPTTTRSTVEGERGTDRQTDRHGSHDLLMRIREILLLVHVVVYEVTLVWCQWSLSSGFPSVWGGRCVEGWRVCVERWGGRIRQEFVNFTEWFPKWWVTTCGMVQRETFVENEHS